MADPTTTTSASDLLESLGGSFTRLFRQLLEARWRDVSFPVTGMTVDIRHDLAVHKPADRDGANVESTGLAPLEFTFEIPFLNGISPAPNETWQRGALYPTQLRAFLTAFQDRSKGLLQHPELGQIFCKPNHASLKWVGTELTGIRVQAAFTQTYADDEGDLSVASPSPIATMHNEAAQLDTNLSAALAIAPSLPSFPASFESFMRGIDAIVDVPTLLSMQVGGKLNSVIGQVNALEDRVELAVGATGAVLWPILAGCEAMKASALAIQKTILQTSNNVAIYSVPVDKTIGALVADLGAYGTILLEDIIKLNPWIMSSPVVPAGAKVRFYGKPAAAPSTFPRAA